MGIQGQVIQPLYAVLQNSLTYFAKQTLKINK